MNDPNIGLILGIAIPVVVLSMPVISYNRFVRQKNHIRESWSNVDTELRRRYDLIPNLVQTVKGYAAHERAVLDEVTQARAGALSSTGPAGERSSAETSLVGALRHLLVTVENYPDLKASQHFLELQQELAITEDRIQAARRFFNANVRDYNRRVQSFPAMVIARLFGFLISDYFEVEAAIRTAGAPQVTLES